MIEPNPHVATNNAFEEGYWAAIDGRKMKIIRFGKIYIEPDENNEPQINVNDFEIRDGTLMDLQRFAIDYIEKALQKSKPQLEISAPINAQTYKDDFDDASRRF